MTSLLSCSYWVIGNWDRKRQWDWKKPFPTPEPFHPQRRMLLSAKRLAPTCERVIEREHRDITMDVTAPHAGAVLGLSPLLKASQQQ